MSGEFFLVIWCSWIGGDLLYTGIKEYNIGHWLYHEGARTSGQVIAVTEKHFGRTKRSYPVINFFIGKKEYTNELAIYNGLFTNYTQGRTVDIAYDPDDPNDCEIADKMRLVSVPMILIVAGFAIVSIGIFTLIMLVI